MLSSWVRVVSVVSMVRLRAARCSCVLPSLVTSNVISAGVSVSSALLWRRWMSRSDVVAAWMEKFIRPSSASAEWADTLSERPKNERAKSIIGSSSSRTLCEAGSLSGSAWDTAGAIRRRNR